MSKNDTFYKAVRLDKTSHWDGKTKWIKGGIVKPDYVDENPAQECGHGIHCSRNLLDAVKYQKTPSIYCEVEPVNIIAEGTDKVRCDVVKVIKWLTQEEQDGIADMRLWEANHPHHPFKNRTNKLDKEKLLQLLRQWNSVWNSVRNSVGNSVRNSVWNSV